MSYSLAKIAEELGLSKATVSMVINGKARKGRISKDVERTVLDFCAKVNYVPNIHAQRINQKRSKTVGFLVNRTVEANSENPFSDMNINGIIGGIVLAAEELGCRVSIQLYNGEEDEGRIFEWLRNREIDGLIYYGISIPEKWKEIFIKEKHCIVGIGTEPGMEIPSVNIDNFNMSRELTKHLINSGRRRFMYISGADGSFVSDERKRGCLSVLKEYHIEPLYVVSGGYSENRAKELVLDIKPMVDAVICANDIMALGAIKAFKELGLNVPRDVAVAGGDNIAICEYASPRLTSYDNSQHLLGFEAVKVLDNMINSGTVQNRIIESNLVIRESTL